MPPMVVNALREWKLKCPKGELGLVFPTGSGNVESHSNIVKRGFEPIQIAAGVFEWEEVKDASGNVVLGDDGKPKMIRAAKYGMHALRHACASLWIENGMNAKRIQKAHGAQHDPDDVRRLRPPVHRWRRRSARRRGYSVQAAWELVATSLQHGAAKSLKSFTDKRLRIRGSGVRISPSAPAKSGTF